MKNLIFQVAVGNVPDYYQTCIDSVERYCTKYNIEHKVLREPQLKIAPLDSKRSTNALRLGYLPIYEKENAFNYLDDYDKICIIDSDVFVRDNAPNIFDQISDEDVFAGVYEKDMPLTPDYQRKIIAYSKGQYQSIHGGKMPIGPWGYGFINMGVMLFTNKLKQYLNGQTPEEFIRRKEFEKFVNGEGNWRWSTDQTLLNTWVHHSGMKIKALDWKWNALFKGVKDDTLQESYFVHFFLSNNLPRKGAEIPEIVKNIDRASNMSYKHK